MALTLKQALAMFWEQIQVQFVKRENGKGLSTNDFTTEEKNKLASLKNTTVDTTLAISNVAADAKAVGDALAGKQPLGDYATTNEFNELGEQIDALTEELHPQSPDKQLVTNYNGDPVWEDRTHWQESRLDVVLPEATIPKKTAYLNDYVYYTRNLQAGHTYNVICDGVEYRCTPVWNSIISSYTIGNASLASFGDDTGEPFFINSQMNMMMTVIYFSTEGEHTISINEGMIESTHQLDEKFIPDTIARKSEVDALSGTVVKSVNGVLPDENGEVSMMIVKNLMLVDATAMAPDILQYYGTETIAEVVGWLRNNVKYYVNFNRDVRGANGKTIETVTNTGADIRKISDGVYNAIVYFGDKYAPIILDSVNNKLTLDPDWVAPTACVKSVNDIAPDENGNVGLPVATDSEIIDVMLELDMLPTIVDADGSVLVDSDETIVLF